ncbi:MAG: type I methionyl aminopeptidase, partial [Deltaproteobacteria bacterium]
VRYKGFYGDSAVTLPVGVVSTQAERLLKVTKDALDVAISNAVIGARLGDISFSVQECAERAGYSVVKDFVGHGIGKKMHEEPAVPNFGSSGTGLLLKDGMVLAIEPMVNEGADKVNVLADRWTVVTVDRKLSAHFEHTVAITKDGPYILTAMEE